MERPHSPIDVYSCPLQVFASPLAKALAKESGIDLSKVAATGPHRRVLAADVLQGEQSFFLVHASYANFP